MLESNMHYMHLSYSLKIPFYYISLITSGFKYAWKAGEYKAIRTTEKKR